MAHPARVRAVDDQGKPTVDELTPDLRTIRAIWARDYNILPDVHDSPKFEFTSPPAGDNFPKPMVTRIGRGSAWRSTAATG